MIQGTRCCLLIDTLLFTSSTAFEMNVAVAILRLKEGLDCSEILADVDELILRTNQNKKNKKQNGAKEPSISGTVNININM